MIVSAHSCRIFPIESERKSSRSGNIALMMLFLLGLFFLLIRAKFGFCFNDEPFCVTLGQRLYQGDSLIVDEWHGCQLFSGIMLPFYAVFRLFSPDNEGILLFLRHTYCVLWWMCSVFVSVSLSRKPVVISLIFSYLLFFSPLDYMTISYTSIGLMSALIICCILYKIPGDTEHFSTLAAVGFGVFWALLVLCSPFMAVAYVGLFLLAVIGNIVEKKKTNSFYFRNLIAIFRWAFVLDAILAALYVTFFLLARADLATILESVPYIFADPEHQSQGLIRSIYGMLAELLFKGGKYLCFSFLVFLYGMIVKSPRFRLPLFTISAALYVQCQIDAARAPYDFNVQMLHIIFLGAVAFALLEKKDYKLFSCFYFFSVCFSVLNGLASNTGILAISATATVAGCAAVVFIIQLAWEFVEQYKQKTVLRAVSVTLISAVFCLQISSEVYVKFNRQYWDAPPSQLTETISCGSAKGLKTAPDIAQVYTSRYKALSYLLGQIDKTDKSFLNCTSAPYIYLDADMDFATFSAWSFGYGDGLNERILNYQEVNPGKTPDVVYCASEDDILPFIDDTYIPYEYEGHFLFVRSK